VTDDVGVHSYALATRMKVFIAAFTAGALIIPPWVGVSSFKRHDYLALVLLVAWYSFALPFLFWNWFLLPWRIDVGPDAICFVARLRSARFQWPTLTSVRSSWFDINRQWLRWAATDGVIWTSSMFDGRTRLLGEVQDRAPQLNLDDI